MAWGRPRSCTCGACRKCKHADYMRGWYQGKTLEERRAWIALRDREKVRAASRARHHRLKGQAEYEARRAAVSAVNNAIVAGKLVRGPCEGCGSTERVQGHHDDYSKPFEVRWLCPPCHAVEHQEAA